MAHWPKIQNNSVMDAFPGGKLMLAGHQPVLLWQNNGPNNVTLQVRGVLVSLVNGGVRTSLIAPFVGTAGSSGQEFGQVVQTPSVLLSAASSSSSNISPRTTYVQIALFDGAQVTAVLAKGYLYAQNVPAWPQTGTDRLAGDQGALFTFQGTVVNGGGGGGDQSLTIQAASGGRVELLSGDTLNGDTVSRTYTATIDDGTNELLIIGTAAVAAASRAQIPGNATALGGNNRIEVVPHWSAIAGDNRIVLEVANVAASQDSAYAVRLLVWGAAPTMTLAGASTPTLTTNTSRFETG